MVIESVSSFIVCFFFPPQPTLITLIIKMGNAIKIKMLSMISITLGEVLDAIRALSRGSPSAVVQLCREPQRRLREAFLCTETCLPLPI